MASDLASPTLARCERRLSFSMNALPASAPPLISKVTTEPPFPDWYFWLRANSGLSSRPGNLTHSTDGCDCRCLATVSAFSQCLSMRRWRVSMPWSACHELSGEMQAPRFLSGTVLMRRM